uniref:DH domain-containing protein n=1 Tax=Romanomermis culicivorax TaxID=13658 RepID=A0A915IUJ3_ROMCU
MLIQKSMDSIVSGASTGRMHNDQPNPEKFSNRRDALVPEEHKVFAESDGSSPNEASSSNQQCDNVIIIPQMQISPHDLHMYNRAITNNGGLLTELQKATTVAQAFYNEGEQSKKPKAPWIFKRLYDWSHRAKAREVVRHVYKALEKVDKEFVDENLTSLLKQNWTNVFKGNPDELENVERKRLQAVWELFHSEVVFLYQHLLILRNVYKEPLKDCQVEGYLLSVEPDLIFGNLDELCQQPVLDWKSTSRKN